MPTGAANAVARHRAAPPVAVNSGALCDASLVGRFNAGDDSAFTEIVSRHQGKIFSLVLGFTHNRADAEDLTQDTFIRAHRGLARFRGDSSLSTWLHRIAFNLARNRYWHTHRRRNISLSVDAPLFADSKSTWIDFVASEAPNPAQEMVYGEISFVLATCLEGLPAPHREIITRRSVLNHTYGEIAQALGINVGTVKSRLARARANLRALVHGMCPELIGRAFVG